jgi:DNA invertase Pin-like site-specific DNA recombinase
LQHKGVDLQVLDQQIDTTTSTGRLLFNVLGAIAQFETEIRAERQRDGIAHAKARGVPFGRHKKLTPQRIAELHARRHEGVPISTLMHNFHISKATIYRYLAHAGPT